MSHCTESQMGTALGTGIMSFALPATMPLPVVFVLLVVVALGTMRGYLLEWVFKREFEDKDAGTWLSGFDGLLDRVDSLPVVVSGAYEVNPWCVKGLT